MVIERAKSVKQKDARVHGAASNHSLAKEGLSSQYSVLSTGYSALIVEDLPRRRDARRRTPVRAPSPEKAEHSPVSHLVRRENRPPGPRSCAYGRRAAGGS